MVNDPKGLVYAAIELCTLYRNGLTTVRNINKRFGTPVSNAVRLGLRIETLTPPKSDLEIMELAMVWLPYVTKGSGHF